MQPGLQTSRHARLGNIQPPVLRRMLPALTALRQTEGLIGSILALLGLDLAVPDHSTLSRRAETLEVMLPRPGFGPVHLLVDSTGLKLCGSGEWLLEKHGTRTRRSWRKLHIGVDADTGRILAAVALSTCWIEVAMARDKEGVLVVTPWRRRRWSRPKPERPWSGRLDTAWRAPGDGGGGRGC